MERFKSRNTNQYSTAQDGYSKGETFERYSLRLFPEKYYKVLRVTPRRNDLDGRFVESALDPDFQLQHISSKHIFWVECKFRSSMSAGKIQWCNGFQQFARYKEFQEKNRPQKVFILIGLGGQSYAPKSMYCIPLDCIAYEGLYLGSIAKYKRNPHSSFKYEYGRLK